MSKDKNVKVSINTGKKRIRSAINKELTGKEEIKDESLGDGLKIVNKHNKKIENAREKRIGKTKLEVEKEIQDEKIELISKKNFLKRIVLIITLIIIAILAYLFFEYGPIFGISIVDSNIENIKIDIVTTDSDIYKMYNEELLVYSSGQVSTYNKSGKVTWTYKLDQMFTPDIYIFENYMVISNNINGTIYLFEGKKEILNKKIDGTIESIYLDNYGNMAIEYSTSLYKKVVGVYDKKGNNIHNTYLENNSIIDIKLLDNANKILLAQANASSFKIGCSLSIYDFKNSDGKENQIAKFDNNFIYNLTISGQDIIILLDNKLVKLNLSTNAITEIKSFNSTQLMYISNYDNYYISVDKKLEDGNLYSITTSDYNNNIISQTEETQSPKLMVSSGLLTYFIYQDEIKVINKWGVEVKKQSLDTTPKEVVVFNNEKSLALIYTNKIYIMNI